MTAAKLRHLLLDHLYASHPLRFNSEQLGRFLKQETGTEIDQKEVNEALELLAGMRHVEAFHDPMGGGRFWRLSDAAKHKKTKGEL